MTEEIPASFKKIIKGVKAKLRNTLHPPIYRSKNTNVFHCTTQKAGSLWLARIFSDRLVYKYSGLTSYSYDRQFPNSFDPRFPTEKFINDPFPRRKIATPLYVDYHSYKSIPKPSKFKTIFVIRDPRDIVVSYYFSTINTHKLIGRIPRVRRALQSLEEQDAWIYMLHYVHYYGIFDSQLSWVDHGSTDPDVLLVRFEDLISEDGIYRWKEVFHHFDTNIPDDALGQVLENNNFASLSGGRQPGIENQDSHYRKGIHGDWVNYFSNTVTHQFKQLTGDLVPKLGYEW
jgi:hypothetical protein